MRELKSLGIEFNFTACQLRHTYATIAANSSMIPLKVLRDLLGHANFQTTMNIYADLDVEKCAKAVGNWGQNTRKSGKKLQ